MVKQVRLTAGIGALLLAAALVAGCAAGSQQVKLSNSESVPAARGTVTSKIAENGNTQFDITVEHLAPPDAVASSARTYVVWLRPIEGNEPPQNVGALQVNRDTLTGSFEGVTSLRRFQLSITAESQTTTQSPSGDQVLTAMVLQPEKK